MADKRALLLLLLAVATTQGQTRIDLASQSRNANFANFLFTTPFTMGPTLPPTCQVGQVFFNTAVPAGQNIYACAQTNAWTALGASNGNYTLPQATSKVLGGVMVPNNSGLLVSSGTLNVAYGSGSGTALQGNTLGQPSGPASLDLTGNVSKAQLGNLGSAAFLNSSAFDVSGAAASAVSSLSLSGPTTAQPALITQGDWATFNGKQPPGNYLTGLSGDVVASGAGISPATVVRINGTSISTNSAANQILGTTGSATGSWLSLLDCQDSGGNHLNYNATAHTFSCGTSSSGGGAGGNINISSGAGAPTASCTAGSSWYLDTTNQDDWFCSVTNTWKKNLSTLNSGPFLATGQTSSSVPAAPQSGNAALFFNSSSIAQTENSSGSVSGTEIAPASSATANQFVTYVDNTGTVHTAQPASTNLSDVANLATNAQSFTAGAFQYDFSGASHTLPSKTGLGASKPATCTVGEEYFATDATAGQNKYYCTATNTWTQQTGGGGSGSGVGTIFNTGYLANTDIGTSWVGLNPGGSQSAEGVMVSVMPVAGVFANMCVSNYIALDASGSIVIELYGGSALTGKTATGITVTIPASAAAGTIACDTTHTFTATAANEFFEYRVTDNNTGGNRYLNSISMQYR